MFDQSLKTKNTITVFIAERTTNAEQFDIGNDIFKVTKDLAMHIHIIICHAQSLNDTHCTIDFDKVTGAEE
jgi:hypothetical protein